MKLSFVSVMILIPSIDHQAEIDLDRMDFTEILRGGAYDNTDTNIWRMMIFFHDFAHRSGHIWSV